MSQAIQHAAARPGQDPTPTPPKAPRVSIFAHLGEGASPEERMRFTPARPLRLDESTLFPITRAEAGDVATMIKALGDGLQTVQTIVDPTVYLAAVHDLLRRVAWCLPNPYAATPESGVSLFDFCRTTAALAPALAASENVTLVEGDISGVQDFIYTISAKGATSGLRGRSFYLQLLTDAIADYLCTQLGLPLTSLLYSGGGHFYLVAPAGIGEDLQALRREISRKLLRHHQGNLYLALGTAELTPDDFRSDRFGSAWQRMSRETGRAKRQRFSELGAAMHEQIFTPRPGSGGDAESECQVCHYGATDKEELISQEDESGETVRICPLCHSFAALGRDLRQANYLLRTAVPPQPANGRSPYHDILTEFGSSAALLDSLDDVPPLPSDGGAARLLALNDSAAVRPTVHLHGRILPLLRHYTVNVTPLIDDHAREEYGERYADKQGKPLPAIGAVKPFTLLQMQAEGVDRFGVLRMDVDDLGDLFRGGFGDAAGLAPTVALSFALTLYFEGWIETLARQIDERDLIYSIYSGGDDLFIVGAWHLLPDLAYRIAADLVRYAAGNTAVHASGGVTLHGSKYPLYQAAQEAEAALDAAKDREGKNAFTFLGRTFAWDVYPAIAEEFQRLTALQERGAPRSLLRRLLQLDALYQTHKEEQLRAGHAPQEVYWGPWHWRSVYGLTRAAQRSRDKKVTAEIEAIRDSLQGENFKRIEWIGLAARWAELFKRNSK